MTSLLVALVVVQLVAFFVARAEHRELLDAVRFRADSVALPEAQVSRLVNASLSRTPAEFAHLQATSPASPVE